MALAEDPATAGYLIGEKIVHPRSFDLGVAVQVEDGVVVPVLRDGGPQDRWPSWSTICDDWSTRPAAAPDRGGHPGGGIATVTNFGTFGLTSGTPIPLPNETLILGIGAGVKRPVWSDEVEAFVPVTESELVLTFDHRVVDGGGAGMLLNRVGELLQEPEKIVAAGRDVR